MDLYDALELVTDDMRFEGEPGVENLETVCEMMGYRRTGFRYGSPLESFLADNPGAQSALLEWMADQEVPEWADNLEEGFGAELESRQHGGA